MSAKRRTREIHRLRALLEEFCEKSFDRMLFADLVRRAMNELWGPSEKTEKEPTQ